jgi:hypothetical protein
VFLEETLGAEVAQDAALDDALKVEPVEGKEVGGLVEAGFPVGPLIEDAVEDDQVEVEPSGPGGEARSASRGSSARPPNDAERSSENWGLRDEPKRWRKLTAPSCAPGGAPGLVRRSDQRFASVPARGQVGQDVVGEVGSHLSHPARVTRRAHPPPLAGEGDQALVAAIVATHLRRVPRACEAVGKDAAAQAGTTRSVVAEIPLDP